jgi:hypothetical protein
VTKGRRFRVAKSEPKTIIIECPWEDCEAFFHLILGHTADPVLGPHNPMAYPGNPQYVAVEVECVGLGPKHSGEGGEISYETARIVATFRDKGDLLMERLFGREEKPTLFGIPLR